jgi:hypothetical protein
MNSSSNSITSCRLCQHYNPEGRRGGLCGKLDIPVRSTWDACSLATHPFETSWQSANDFNLILNESFHDTIALTQGEISDLQEVKGRSLSFAE